MNFINEEINAYAEAHSTADADLLQELQRETYIKTLMPQMISTPLQGGFLKMISGIMQPKTILEIGTFTGYATLCLAAGLAPGGMIHTIDVNEEMNYFHKKYFTQSPYGKQIAVHYGNAKEIIPKLNFDFNVSFIDADKMAYADYYDLVIEKTTKNGLIIADNVLWSGKVLNPLTDKDAQCLDAFNKKVNADARVENVLLPIRDGLMLMRKL